MLFILHICIRTSHSFSESLSVQLCPHRWSRAALAVVSSDVRVVSCPFSACPPLDPAVVPSVLLETLPSPGILFLHCFGDIICPAGFLSHWVLSPVCWMCFLIPAWSVPGHQGWFRPQTSAPSPLGKIGRIFWKKSFLNKSFKFCGPHSLSQLFNCDGHQDSPRYYINKWVRLCSSKTINRLSYFNFILFLCIKKYYFFTSSKM